MTIYPLSGASWPAKQLSSSAIEEALGYGHKREMQMCPSLCRGSPRQWELRRIASLPVLDADDYWSDASLSLPHLASALPQVEEKETVCALRCSPNEDACQGSATHMSGQNLVDEEPIKATRFSIFPPPLDSPAHLWCEGRYPYLQTVEKACFTFVRSNGRLLVTETPVAAQPRRHLCSQRRNGRLLLQLHVESSSREEELERLPLAAGGEESNPIVAESDPIVTESNPIAEKARRMSPFAENAKERAQKASPYSYDEEGEVAEEEDIAEGGEKLKLSLYTKVLQTLECDAFSDSIEAVSPINQLHLKYGRRSSGLVASFLHKSLTRVRPLDMLTIWQTLPIQT